MAVSDAGDAETMTLHPTDATGDPRSMAVRERGVARRHAESVGDER